MRQKTFKERALRVLGYVKIPAIAVLWIFIGYQSFRISAQYGGTDLRARVVGARLLFTENSPYFYKWKVGDPEQLLDPNIQTGRKVNGNVVTPAVHWLMQPLVLLPYGYIRPLWTLFEILAACLTIFWLSGKKGVRETAGFSWLPALLLLAGPYWFYHIDRGQMYIFYTAIIAGMWRLYNRNGKGIFWSGLLAGLLVFIRPFAVCFALPFLAVQQKNWLKGFATGIFFGTLTWILPMLPEWKDYASAMKIYSAEATGIVTAENVFTLDILQEVEQMQNLGKFNDYPINAFPTLLDISQKWGLIIPQWAAYSLLILFMITMTTLIIRKKIISPERLWLSGFLLMMACEYTTHAPRAPYNLLLWLAPVCIWLSLNRVINTYLKWSFVIILFVFLHPAFFFQKSMGYAAEMLLFFTALYAVFSPSGFLFRINRPEK